jgi:hypothetical protein
MQLFTLHLPHEISLNFRLAANLITLAFAPITEADTIQPDNAQLAQFNPLPNACIVTNIQQGQLTGSS